MGSGFPIKGDGRGRLPHWRTDGLQCGNQRIIVHRLARLNGADVQLPDSDVCKTGQAFEKHSSAIRAAPVARDRHGRCGVSTQFHGLRNIRSAPQMPASESACVAVTGLAGGHVPGPNAWRRNARDAALQLALVHPLHQRLGAFLALAVAVGQPR